MTEPFLVVNIIEGVLGVIYSHDLYADALECAAKLAAEQCAVSIEEALDELEVYANFHNIAEDITVYIAQAE